MSVVNTLNYTRQPDDIKQQLLYKFIDIIHASSLTQVQVAKLVGVSQPRISSLLSGKFELFSVSALVQMMSNFGLQVNVSFIEPADMTQQIQTKLEMAG